MQALSRGDYDTRLKTCIFAELHQCLKGFFSGLIPAASFGYIKVSPKTPCTAGIVSLPPRYINIKGCHGHISVVAIGTQLTALPDYSTNAISPE